MYIKLKLELVSKTLMLIGFFLMVSCGDDYVPKPKAYLRLEYPQAKYIPSDLNLPFTFNTNINAKKISSKSINNTIDSYGINIEYPELKGTIFLTYKTIDSEQKNLIDLLRDAQNFTQKHTMKADEIPVYPYENKERRVYGAIAEVKGNVASPAQFYVTDSIKHFLTGSLYFYAKPNYDSILPAANYLQNDMKQIMESITWK